MGGLRGLLVRMRTRKQEKRHMQSPVSQAAVHAASLYLRRPRGMYRGSGREKTSTGRVRPSRGNRDSVSDGARSNRGGGSGGGLCLGGVGGGLGMLDGEAAEPTEEGEGERRGDAWASQPLLASGSETPRRCIAGD